MAQRVARQINVARLRNSRKILFQQFIGIAMIMTRIFLYAKKASNVECNCIFQ